jgi:Sporulation and spore germination
VIARHQAVLFAVLLAASAAMGVVLWRQLDRAHQRLLAGGDSAPTHAPQVAPTESATLLVADDAGNSLIPQVQSLPLPQDPGARARLVLGKLLDLYAAPDAAHPVPGGASGIAQVFLLPAASLAHSTAEAKTAAPNTSRSNAEFASPPLASPELAVVNLTGAFAASHPSGLETETLTVLSLCGTLHANLPQVTEVRFLVDGQPRATLSGHADLTRTYLAGDAAPTAGAHP